ncbi:MAG TPA: acyl carrier protein [Pseudonocardiaceae bacterium]
MTAEQVHALVEEFVRELHPDVSSVPTSADLAELGVDSLSFVDLLSALERRSGVEIPDDLLPRLTTVRDLMDHIASRAHA